MADIDERIERTWGRGRAAIDAAVLKLEAARDCGEPSLLVDELLASLAAGALADAFAAAAGLQHPDSVQDELRTAIEARNQIIALTQEAYGPGFARLARSFHRARDSENDIAGAWEKVLRNIFRWRQEGDFKSWLTAAFRNALRDGLRTGERQDAKHLHYAAEAEVHGAVDLGPAGHTEKGTTTFGAELALQSFKDSLDPEKRQLWDAWVRLTSEGRRAEDIYHELGGEHARSAGAVKAILLRLQADFRELAGATASGEIDASRTLALWVGSERSGGETAILATGIDIDDNLRLLGMRQVRYINMHTFSRLFETLRRWHLPDQILVIIDDSEGLREAVRENFPPDTPVQRCLDSLHRSITSALPRAAAASFARDAGRAHALRSASQAHTKLSELSASLRKHHPHAATVLCDALDETLTVKCLALPASLEMQLTRVKFLADAAPVGAGPFAWLGAVFAGLRERRSVERRRAGLRTLAAILRRSSA